MKYTFTLLIVVVFICQADTKEIIDRETEAQISKNIELLHTLKNYSYENMGIDFLTVGADNQCNYSNIQDAIDDFAQSPLSNIEIRIATNKTYVENLIIDNLNLSLVGGYDNCTISGQSGTPDNTRVTIDGSNVALPVIRITGSSQRNTILLENLKLQNGIGTGLQTGGGLNAFDANVQILLNSVDINNNTGSGLAIIGGTTTDTDIVMIDSIIDSNTANNVGGGIYCEGSDASIIIGADSGIVFNQVLGANGKGGGAYIISGCNFSMYSAGMVQNMAKSDGGGLYVGDGARAFLIGREVCSAGTCLGDNIRPVRFNANQADSDSSGQGNGGAVYITGSSTFVSMSQIWLDDNRAASGGAISVHEGAALMIDRVAKNCWNSHIDDKCNLIESNLAISSGLGGAINNNNSQIEVLKTYLENNRADLGTAIYSVGNSAVSIIVSSLFNNNGNDGLGGFSDQHVVRAFDGAQYLINYSTFADNHAQASVFGISGIGNSILTLNKSIVDDSDSGDVLNLSFGTANLDCILAHEIDSITGTQLFIGNPQFVDRNNGNYHLNAAISPAVDLCNDSGNGPLDIDTDFRGWDDPTVVNQGSNPNARYDAGADETYDNDIIFISGLE
ncbi:MAG: hypothetical protein JKY19_15850 [Alcanivoracaceae bacterium]|nr:hypothetical protein [Alcanivoracaceae bacterium]